MHACLQLHLSFLVVLNTDFSTTDPDVSFPLGPLMPGCITVIINQDMSVEGDHTFSVSLNPGPISPTVTVGRPDTTVVTITDDASDSKYQIALYSIARCLLALTKRIVD